MKERQVFLSGKWVPESQAVVSVFDRGFTLGDAFYEAMRTFNHQPFKVREHTARLYRSLKVGRIEPGLTSDQMVSTIEEAVERNASLFESGDDFTIYVYVSRGPGGHALRSGPPTTVIAVKPIGWSEYAKFYNEGVRLVTPSIRRQPSECWDAKIKTTSRINHTLAELEATQADPEAYCLMLDLDGNVAEHRSSNFCIVRDGVIESPTSTNVLRGVTLGTVFELAQSLGIPTRERDIQPYDVYNADEAFLVSTSFCLLPASRLNGTKIGAGNMPRPISQKLLEAFGKKVGKDIVSQALSRAG